MKKSHTILLISYLIICAMETSAVAATFRTCLAGHYPNFKGTPAGWGYMPAPVEQEAICRAEFDGPELQLAVNEVKGEEKNPVTFEMRKLWLMDRIYRQNSDELQGTASVFSRNIVKNPPQKYLGIIPGTKPEKIAHLDTTAKRERAPDLLHTLDQGKAAKIYLFRRSDERLAAVCVEPKEDGACKEIVPKEKYDLRNNKKPAGEEEGGFKRFMKKVKSSVTGPSTKEITEMKTLDFYGVRISDVSYSFDYEFSYIGFFARIANREPFAVKESPQYIRDVFGTLIRQFGEPALKGKETIPGKPGASTSYAIWLTNDGFRIDAVCENPSADSGLCQDGHIAVRRLSPAYSSHSTEGAAFFE